MKEKAWAEDTFIAGKRWLMRADGGEEEKGGKGLTYRRTVPPRRPCTEAESRSRLYLAQGPQIVKSAPGPSVQTGKDRCHPSRGPGARHDPISRHRTPSQGRSEGTRVVCAHICVTHVQSWSHSVGAARGKKIRVARASDGRSVAAALRPSSRCVRVYSRSPTSSFLAPLKQLKRPHISPITSTHVCWNLSKNNPSCLSGQDWHSVQMSKQLKLYFFFFASLFVTFPRLHHLQNCSGVGEHVSGDWWRPEPFRHHSPPEVWQDSHIERARIVVKRCSSEWLSTRYIRLEDQTLDGGGLERLAVSSLTERGGRGQLEIMSAVMHADKFHSR